MNSRPEMHKESLQLMLICPQIRRQWKFKKETNVLNWMEVPARASWAKKATQWWTTLNWQIVK